MNGYEINVCVKKGKYWAHLFATDTRSCQTKEQARELYNLIKEKFPEPEYDVSVSCWETVGHPVEF